MAGNGLKKAIIVGAILGSVITLGIALSMDMVLGDALHGTWRDAAARDVTRMFGPDCGRNAFAVTGLLLTVMGFLAAFGGLLGAAAGAFMNRFFKVILK
jgi:hypothetical protein